MREKDHGAWLRTPAGDLRGYIETPALSELWFHTGTNCNLRCPFCFEGSRPGDDRISFITLQDAKPFIDEALSLGVIKFSFTGGEPFINPYMIEMLDYALEHRPCLVLTNGTKPLLHQFARVEALKKKPHDLSFRVSLDHPDPDEHDASRGEGNFTMALQTLGRLHEAGFGVSMARLQQPDENSPARDARYATHFDVAGLPPHMLIVKFPDFQLPGAIAHVPDVTEHCMTSYTTEAQREQYMCRFSRMVVKKNGRCGVYACTLVDDDDDFDLGSTLRESMDVRVRFKHHRCYSCFAYGSSCSEGA